MHERQGRLVSTAHLETYLKDTEFPLSKEEVVEYAENSLAPEPVIELLESLPNRDYDGIPDVERGLEEL
jgi:hypothetical protein